MKLQKETESSRARHGRWYGDACGTAFALELVGERWSLLIVRELMLGGRRFSDLRRVLPGISAKVLTERLESLEAAGVLTGGGGPARSPAHAPPRPLTPVSRMRSMRTMTDQEAAGLVPAAMRFEGGEDRFFARLQDGEFTVARAGEGDPPADFTVRMEKPLPYLRVVYGKQPLESVTAEGELAVEGDVELAKRAFAVFSLPPKIGS